MFMLISQPDPRLHIWSSVSVPYSFNRCDLFKLKIPSSIKKVLFIGALIINLSKQAHFVNERVREKGEKSHD